LSSLKGHDLSLVISHFDFDMICHLERLTPETFLPNGK